MDVCPTSVVLCFYLWDHLNSWFKVQAFVKDIIDTDYEFLSSVYGQMDVRPVVGMQTQALNERLRPVLLLLLLFYLFIYLFIYLQLLDVFTSFCA